MTHIADHSEDPQTGNGEVRIGNHYYPVQNGSMNVLNLARFQNKVTFGPYNQDSDPLISAWILKSFTGGMGNETLQEGVEDDTFWDGTLETRFPDGATLLPLSEGFVGTDDGASNAYPLGDFPASDPVFHASFDDVVHTWDSDNQVFVVGETLPSTPVERGVEFNGYLYVPLGSAGYATIDNSGNVTDYTDIYPVHFLVWDRKLCALTTTGYLRIMPRGGSWTDEEDWYRLPDGNMPRKLVNFINQSNVPTIHVVSDSLVFAWDPDGEELYETRLDFPKHPDQGRGAVNWRGDTMYVSVGLGVHGYNGSLITSMGPDGRHGLPSRLRGTIVDLLSEYNALLALVEGLPDANAEVTEEGFAINTPLYQNQHTWAISDLPYQPVHSSILRWSNSQWHKVWESEGATGFPNWMYLSQAEGEYCLWWGYGAQMFRQDLPRSFQNPKQGLKSGTQRFMPSGFITTGWFDADMAAFTKTAQHVEVNLEDVIDNDEAGGTVRISYQRDNDREGVWKLLGEASTVGKTIMPFANHPRENGEPFSAGTPFRRIRFLIEYERRVIETLSPLMESMVFKFIKIPESQWSWSWTSPLIHDKGFKGVGNDDLAQYLNDLLTSEENVEFGYMDTTYRVRLAQVSGQRQTGYDTRGVYQINAVEVSLGSRREATTRIVFTDVAAD